MYTTKRCVAASDRPQVLCSIAIRAHAEKARGYLSNVTEDWCVLELRTRCLTKKQQVRKYTHSINTVVRSHSCCVQTAEIFDLIISETKRLAEKQYFGLKMCVSIFPFNICSKNTSNLLRLIFSELCARCAQKHGSSYV